jgi:hydrogenase maturation protein HypF
MRLGALLPYSPLHALLLDRLGFPVVATSGNRAGEPLCTTTADAQARLAGIADVFLVHDRPILRALDDSLVQMTAGRLQVLRLARGYAPLAVNCSEATEPVLALGGHLKAALAVGGEGRFVLGQHLGDLDNSAALAGFDAAARELPVLAGVRPARLACDAHPDYASSLRAAGLGQPVQRVQHHHAHVATVMAEHGLGGDLLGVAFDGAGLGSDGALWGGEFLLASRQRFRRVAWLRPFPLPGGEQAAREPRRAALGLLYARFGPDLSAFDLPPLRAFSPAERRALLSAVERGINAPLTSSVGRLFDAVAALLGLCQRMSFEGQAALALQTAAEAAPPQAPYPLPLVGMDPDFSIIPAHAGIQHPVQLDVTAQGGDEERGLIADWQPWLDALLADLAAGMSTPLIAGRFHATLAALIVSVARRLGARRVALAGGCFQNRLLLELTAARLADVGVAVFWPQQVPPGDGGLALGQAAVCAAQVPAAARPVGETG